VLDAIKQSGAAGVKTLMEGLVANGRSTSGTAQKHDVEVSIHNRENLVFGKKAARAKAKRSKDP